MSFKCFAQGSLCALWLIVLADARGLFYVWKWILLMKVNIVVAHRIQGVVRFNS